MTTEQFIRNINLHILTDIKLTGDYQKLYSYMNEHFGNLNIYKHIDKDLFYIGKDKDDLKFIYLKNDIAYISDKDWFLFKETFRNYKIDYINVLKYYLNIHMDINVRLLYVSGISTNGIDKYIYLWNN